MKSLKAGDRVVVRSSLGDQTATVINIFWRAVAGTCVSYIHSIEVIYENGMKASVVPERVEILK